jgi:putative acetyltransferase
MSDKTAIRGERPGDEAAIRAVHRRAFGQPSEANIVDALRHSCPHQLSLVATRDELIVGHILFTPARVETIVGVGLAPLAVLPEAQRQGVGTGLVTAGLADIRDRRCPFVIVLGHPELYSRFGFVPASRFRIACPYDNIPDEAFMILLLDEKQLHGVSGMAHYRPEFSTAV